MCCDAAGLCMVVSGSAGHPDDTVWKRRKRLGLCTTLSAMEMTQYHSTEGVSPFWVKGVKEHPLMSILCSRKCHCVTRLYRKDLNVPCWCLWHHSQPQSYDQLTVLGGLQITLEDSLEIASKLTWNQLSQSSLRPDTRTATRVTRCMTFVTHCAFTRF